MMKNIFYCFKRGMGICLLFFVFSITSTAQLASGFSPAPQSLLDKEKLDTSTYKATYTFKYKRHHEQQEYQEDIRVVQIGRKVVKDFSESIYHYDSIATINYEKGLATSSNTETPYPFEIFNNYVTKKCDIQYRLFLNAGTLCYSSDIPRLKWEFSTDDEENMYGYICNKATTRFGGREYTAWYTLDIPLQYGPYKFRGLPGLILKIEDADKMFIWELASFTASKSGIYRYKYDKEQKCTPKEASKAIKRMMTTPYSFLHSAGTRVNVRGADGVFRPRSNDDQVYEFDPIEIL